MQPESVRRGGRGGWHKERGERMGEKQSKANHRPIHTSRRACTKFWISFNSDSYYYVPPMRLAMRSAWMLDDGWTNCRYTCPVVYLYYCKLDQNGFNVMQMLHTVRTMYNCTLYIYRLYTNTNGCGAHVRKSLKILLFSDCVGFFSIIIINDN